MKIIVLLLSIWIFLKTTAYGMYEYRNHNKIGGVLVFTLSTISLLLPNAVVFFNY